MITLSSATVPHNAKIALFIQQKQSKSIEQIRKIKYGVWAYFLLLIFEGALRKWILPQLATPLLVVRDPIALWVILKTWQQGLLKPNGYMITIIIVGITGIFTALLFGHGNVTVALYGARTLLIHFPFMFAIAVVFDHEDVVKLGKTLLGIAIPMAILIAIQFYSPQSSFVNKGIGDDDTGAGFRGALGFFRPPGTFSFTNGNSLFFSLVAPFVFYFFLSSNKINKFFLTLAAGALLVSIPLSISRSLFFSVMITFIFSLVIASRTPKLLNNVGLGVIGIVILGLLLSQIGIFQTAIEVLITRFTQADTAEGGVQGVLLDRYLGGLIGALSSSTEVPYFGFGLGIGTNAGAVLLTGKTVFLISEGEWGRVIGELGALLGLLVIFIRLMFSADITIVAFKELSKNNLLPWLLLSFGLLNIPQGQWGQPTSLGFSTIIGGLILASFNTKNSYGLKNS